MSGPEEAYARGEEIARTIYKPVMKRIGAMWNKCQSLRLYCRKRFWEPASPFFVKQRMRRCGGVYPPRRLATSSLATCAWNSLLLRKV